MAERRPLVLVFEDLHWADESLLDFVDELVDWVTDVPLLVVATARPELLERRAGLGRRQAERDDARALAALRRADRPADRPAARPPGLPPRRSRRCSSAREEIRSTPSSSRSSTSSEARPRSFRCPRRSRASSPRASTASRRDEKEILRDAAVVGKVFWVGRARPRRARCATATLHALERKGFVRRQRRSSVEGEAEIAFAHALVRDVAYGQIARADRAEKHRRVAEWIESLGRSEDHAEMLAHHWRSALELARAAGRDGGDLADRARLALRDAGDRAFALNAFAAADGTTTDALALWPEDDSERAELLFRRARALYIAGDERRQAALEEARDALLAAGDIEAAAEAEAFLATRRGTGTA